ncbi:CoA ester lyase [Sporichthya sp.]|uniref:HpcH/HpaI aldolase/citrate lyase family protein n=1 Tax=Sporichthya sp. TaxID=65475 RepID=UPI0017C1634B|nr:CoA ester lyase [Sporichthya sp.]MBA3741429.1 CoA ester lyase [Sporichthya sp.]
MKLLRSLLFVPGHRAATWGAKGVASGADALIFDLEDSVPADLKAQGRRTVAAAVQELRGQHPNLGLYVRLNSLDSGLVADDLEAVGVAGLDGFVLPKTYGPLDVVRFDALVAEAERRAGLPEQSLEYILALETAEAYATCDQLATASPRVATLFAGTARDADVARSVGFRFTPGGLETLYLRSKALLATRAAGLEHPLIGLWQDIHDLEGCRQFAFDNRGLGYRGQVVIHPSHVPVVNEVFSPSAAEVDFYEGMIQAFEVAERDGIAAIDYAGQHIDYAHIKTAREVVALSQRLSV